MYVIVDSRVNIDEPKIGYGPYDAEDDAHDVVLNGNYMAYTLGWIDIVKVFPPEAVRDNLN